MIRIDDVLSTLGYQWSGASLADTSTGKLVMDGKSTIEKITSIILPQQKSGRPIGPPFSFALRHFKGEMRETTDFFQKHFGIESPILSHQKKNTETGEIEKRRKAKMLFSL